MPKNISMNEIMAELKKLEQEAEGGPEGFTVEDVAEAQGIGLHTVRVRIKKWIKEGVVESNGERYGKGIAHRGKWAPVYRVRKEKK